MSLLLQKKLRNEYLFIKKEVHNNVNLMNNYSRI